MVIYYLTCANKDEAQKITQELLEAKLVACVRQAHVSSSYWWDGKINHDNEVLLMMESLEDKFAAVEAVVTKLHSYDEFVLTMVPVQKTTSGVQQWLDNTLKQ